MQLFATDGDEFPRLVSHGGSSDTTHPFELLIRNIGKINLLRLHIFVFLSGSPNAR